MSASAQERMRELAARAGLGDLSAGAFRAIVAAACMLTVLAAWRFWPRAPAPELAFDEAPPPAGQAAAETTVSPPPQSLVVHVAGAVMRPGVYQLPCGSRVADALQAAGGSVGDADTDAINLARLLTDGEQVYIPTAEEVAKGLVSPPSPAPTTGSGGSAAGTLVDVNRATAAELETLPGVGPSTAQKIIDDREKNGPFSSPEDLMRVPGIGPKKFESLKDLVTCG